VLVGEDVGHYVGAAVFSIVSLPFHAVFEHMSPSPSAATHLPIRLTPTRLPFKPSTSFTSALSLPVEIAHLSGESTYVPTSPYDALSPAALLFPKSATKPSVKPMATSRRWLSSEVLSRLVRSPVPVGTGMSSALRLKCFCR
jgi:hypothetical protein